MLTPADIVAAKLLVQLKQVRSRAIREHMHAVDRDPDGLIDLVSRLKLYRLISAEQAKRIRRYVALFEHIRHEAVYLRRLERAKRADPERIYDLIAEAEHSAYQRQLKSSLVDLGILSEEEAAELERRTRRVIRKEDLRVLARYRKEEFRGVRRPLLPNAPADDTAFRISTVFRTEQTVELVNARLHQLQIAEAEPPPLPPLATLDPEVLSRDEDELDAGLLDTAEVESLDGARFPRETPARSDPRLAELEVIGHYSLVQNLGAGAMGAVFLAQDMAGSLVALKLVFEEGASDESLARFEREAHVCTLLDHPHTTRLLEQGRTTDGIRYLVTPAFAGTSLRDMVQLAPRGLEPRDVFVYMLQLLDALEFVHGRRVVHRDLKPDNVLVVLTAADPQVKLVDFGIARVLDDDDPPAHRQFRSEVGGIVGAPPFVAPETIAGDVVDARTDLYSLGILWFYVLTGRLPLTAPSSYDYLREHLVGIPRTLQQARPETAWHPELERLLATMLAKEPADRPASCAAIREQLVGGLSEEVLAYAQRAPEPPADPAANPYFKNPLR